MQEQNVQGNQLPLRVRLRPPLEQGANGQKPIMPVSTLTTFSEPQQRAQQIKELLRLGNLLRADIGLSEVLHRIAASTSVCTGFRILVVNLIIDEDNICTRPVAFAGVSEEGERLLRTNPMTIEQMHTLMQPEFRISQSYFS